MDSFQRGGGLLELTLKLDFVLNHKGLALIVDFLGEFGRDGVVSRGILDDKTFVAGHALVDVWLFHCPLADIGPLFLAILGVLLGVGWLPSLLPVVGELLEEGRLELGRLGGEISNLQCIICELVSSSGCSMIQKKHLAVPLGQGDVLRTGWTGAYRKSGHLRRHRGEDLGGCGGALFQWLLGIICTGNSGKQGGREGASHRIELHGD